MKSFILHYCIRTFGIMILISIVSTSAFSHNKVVVVPLNSTNIIGVYSEPYQYHSSGNNTTIGSSMDDVFFSLYTDPVPSGKQLFIQYISFQSFSDSSYISGQPICSAVSISSSGLEAVHPLLLTKSTKGTLSFSTITTPLMLFADPGGKIGVQCQAYVSNSIYYIFGASGYYVDQ